MKVIVWRLAERLTAMTLTVTGPLPLPTKLTLVRRVSGLSVR